MPLGVSPLSALTAVACLAAAAGCGGSSAPPISARPSLGTAAAATARAACRTWDDSIHPGTPPPNLAAALAQASRAVRQAQAAAQADPNWRELPAAMSAVLTQRPGQLPSAQVAKAVPTLIYLCARAGAPLPQAPSQNTGGPF